MKNTINKKIVLEYVTDLLVAVTAGLIVSVAYYFFQNSNGFAPGGVGGLATMTYHYLQSLGVHFEWAYLMILFNIPIFVLVTIFVNKKLGIFLIVYMLVQSFGTTLWEAIGFKPYCAEYSGKDYEVVFACIATGVISGFGFSLMLRRFGASGGTYAISSLIKKSNPALNIAYVSFLMDSSVVGISFFVYGMRIAPVICTLINLFVANVVVDFFLTGMRAGYKFEIITDNPEQLSQEIIEKLHHGVTEIRVEGMYSHTEKFMVVCIIRKKQIGQMMKIIKKHPGTFANYSKINEVFGRFAE